MSKEKYFVYYVEQAVWGAYKPRKVFFRKRENAKLYADNNDYTSNVHIIKVSQSDYGQMYFED